MKLIAFITDYQAVDRIINHLKLTFTAAKPPPARIASQELLIAAEAGAEYFLMILCSPEGEVWVDSGFFRSFPDLRPLHPALHRVLTVPLAMIYYLS
jgi:hypothetical protein